MKVSRINLSQTKALSLLSDDDLAKFTHQFLNKSTLIYSDKLKIIIIKSGSAKISFFEGGEEFIIYRAYADNIAIIDEICAFEALEDAEIYSVEIDFMSELFNNQNFTKTFINAVLNIITLQNKIIHSILFESAKGKIAEFIIELALEQNLTQNGYYYLFLPFSLKVLSNFVGLKRQSVWAVFNELIKDGIIRRLSAHEFLIIDFKKLQSYTTQS